VTKYPVSQRALIKNGTSELGLRKNPNLVASHRPYPTVARTVDHHINAKVFFDVLAMPFQLACVIAEASMRRMTKGCYVCRPLSIRGSIALRIPEN